MIGVLAAILWALVTATLFTDRSLICENTGSRMSYREWFFGAKTNEEYEASALEVFLKREHPGKLRHRWNSYRGTGFGLLMTSHGHGRPGAILDPDKEMLDSYVHSLSDEQRLGLYRDFSMGDERVVEERVERIYHFFLKRSPSPVR